ncbi:hypothetical protein AKJ58_00850 [candidate division MSBL1 archaeon SCGC-AAA385D11]|uniref:Radical SAM core domain-containing protein n=1 Tax=candidate division MSBL1 archaeon SCGC-AAA385D11 TaxID=1698286 RepID=A0A133VNT6_9EURY|nr:hypothetical protein AKJ58_00850 [candidate division MSBL1 archaeon SCGC-AAA385D11]
MFVEENAKEKIWEFRTPLIPKINEDEVKYIGEFLSDIDEELPLNFLAFRPNFVLENHLGAKRAMMKRAVEAAKKAGLKNVSWSGHTDLSGYIAENKASEYGREGGKLAGGYAKGAGCVTHPRNCGSCKLQQQCPIKKYKAKRRT